MEKDASDTLRSLSVRTVKSVRQKVSSPLRRTAADRRDRPRGAEEGARRDPRRADGGPGVAQTEQVLNLVERLAEQGVAVILISHNLADVFEVADDIAVLYLGTMVAEIDVADTTRDDVVGYITGTKTLGGVNISIHRRSHRGGNAMSSNATRTEAAPIRSRAT